MNVKVNDEINTNLGLPRGQWLWLDELAVARARATGGKKPPKKALVREAIDLLRAAEAQT